MGNSGSTIPVNDRLSVGNVRGTPGVEYTIHETGRSRVHIDAGHWPGRTTFGVGWKYNF